MKRKINRALISVSDKSNLASLMQILNKYNIEIISSGGTFDAIKNLDINVKNYQNIQNLKKCLMEE